jgi:hypothetical protein
MKRRDDSSLNSSLVGSIPFTVEFTMPLVSHDAHSADTERTDRIKAAKIVCGETDDNLVFIKYKLLISQCVYYSISTGIS